MATEDGIDMLSDFLELQRYKKERFLSTQKIDLKRLINEIVKELYLDIKSKKVEIKKSFPDEKIYISANEKWLKKALFNIIHNAIKYNKEKGEVFIHLQHSPGGLFILIKDSGIGISDLEKSEVFKKFVTKDERKGSGIGLSMAYSVIESFGGKITFQSEPNKGTSFYIYLPNVAKNVKIKRLATALSSVVIASLVLYDYYFCLIPQNIDTKISGNIIVYEFENGVKAIAKKDDNLEIVAKKNLFGTKFKTAFYLKKSDIEISTNHQPLLVDANGVKLKNYGTRFETVTSKEKFATSIYEGKVALKERVINQNEGVVKKGANFFVEKLPKSVSGLSFENEKNGDIKVYWESGYRYFRVTVSKSKRLDKEPIYRYKTSERSFNIDSVRDGIWYVGVQSEKNSLYSKPSVIEILVLKDYLKALNLFKKGNYDLADEFVQRSLETVNKASFKPYLLRAKILLLKNRYKEALKYSKEAYSINPDENSLYILAKNYFYLNNFTKSLEYLKALKNGVKKYMLLAKIYSKLKNNKLAKEYLFKVLELDPNNQEAIKMLISIFKKEKNSFMVQIFQNKLFKGQE